MAPGRVANILLWCSTVLWSDRTLGQWASWLFKTNRWNGKISRIEFLQKLDLQWQHHSYIRTLCSTAFEALQVPLAQNSYSFVPANGTLAIWKCTKAIGNHFVVESNFPATTSLLNIFLHKKCRDMFLKKLFYFQIRKRFARTSNMVSATMYLFEYVQVCKCTSICFQIISTKLSKDAYTKRSFSIVYCYPKIVAREKTFKLNIEWDSTQHLSTLTSYAQAQISFQNRRVCSIFPAFLWEIF